MIEQIIISGTVIAVVLITCNNLYNLFACKKRCSLQEVCFLKCKNKSNE